MGYIQLNLADGERVVYRTKLHWIIFLRLLLFLLAACAAFVAGSDVLSEIFLILALFWGVFVFDEYLRSEFVVTSRKVVGKIAFGIRPYYYEVSLIELREVAFKPGLLGGLFDYGTVVITDRRGVRHKFPGVPGEFYRQVEARDARVRRILR